MAVLEHQHSLELISCEIWVTKKSWNIHTVTIDFTKYLCATVNFHFFYTVCFNINLWIFLLSFFPDQPDPAGTGGGSNTGNKAQAFFDPENREALKMALNVSFNFFECTVTQFYRVLFKYRISKVRIWPIIKITISMTCKLCTVP